MNGELTNEEVLERNIPWESYKITSQIADREYALIKRLDKSTKVIMCSAMEENGPAVFEALFGLLRTVTNESTVQYTLATLDVLTTLQPERAADMHVASRNHPASSTPTSSLTLSRLLSRPDVFTQTRAAKLLALSLTTAQKMDWDIVTLFLDWLIAQLRGAKGGESVVVVATGALGSLLRNRDVRRAVAQNLPLLEATLKKAVANGGPARSQILYNCGLCLWQLSFDELAMQQLRKSRCVEPLVDLLKQGNKEKVMRIALMMLERLINVGDLALEAAMVECGLPRIVRIRSAQSFADEDIPELLERLEDSLSTKVSAMSSLDKYRAEVLSGQLEWGPMHSSPQFWQENSAAMESKDFQLIRSLIKVAQTSEDPKVLAVAMNDFGMFIDANPHGRFIINDLGGKQPVMALMQHPSSEVQKYALLCVQRLMLGRDKLDFLRRPGAAASRQTASTSA